MFAKNSLLLLLFLTIGFPLFGQQDHIPLVIVSWGTDNSTSTLNSIAQLNPDAICLKDIDDLTVPDYFLQSNINLIPYNLNLIQNHDDGREKIARNSSGM